MRITSWIRAFDRAGALAAPAFDGRHVGRPLLSRRAIPLERVQQARSNSSGHTTLHRHADANSRRHGTHTTRGYAC